MIVSYPSLVLLSASAVLMIWAAWVRQTADRQVSPLLFRAKAAEVQRTLQAVDAPCFIIDNMTHVILANDKMHTLIHLAPGSLVGVPCADLFVWPNPQMTTTDVRGEQIAEIIRWDGRGTSFRVKLRHTALNDRSGKRVGTLVTLSDPARIRDEAGALSLEQLWETLLEKQSRDLEEKNRELEASGAQLQQLVERIGSIKDQEGIRISRVLSGELFGLLTQIRANVAALRQHLGQAFETRVDSVLEVIDTAVGQVDHIMEGIRPSVLDGGHLGEAIEKIAAHFEAVHRIAVKTRVNVSAKRLDIDSSCAIFRIVQESLTNIARHAGATEAQISLSDTANGVALVVEDNGRGVVPDELVSASALGVMGMKERAKSLGGVLDIRNREIGGAVVSLFLPKQR